MSHRNAGLTVFGRLLLVERVLSGRPVAHVAAEMGISQATAHKWMRRWRAEGQDGLHDRFSRPHTTPHRTADVIEARVCELRRTRKLGPRAARPDTGPSLLDRAPDPDPPRPAPPRLDRPAHRCRNPPLRTRAARRTDPRRREKARPDGGHRILGREAGRPHTWGEIRLHPLRGRRPLTPCLQRDPPGRESRDMRGLPYPGSRVLPQPRHPTRRAGADRQRAERSRPTGRRRENSPAPTARRPTAKSNASNRTMLDEWAYLLPYTSNGRADRSTGRLPPHLQPPPLPHRTRRTPAHQSCEQPCGSIHPGPHRICDALVGLAGPEPSGHELQLRLRADERGRSWSRR
ncbi:hypothetical protein QFZ58_000035 [Streptomyces sp. B1I3]|nr:hypothetical protein [Streptomyces sp. B1I3]